MEALFVRDLYAISFPKLEREISKSRRVKLSRSEIYRNSVGHFGCIHVDSRHFHTFRVFDREGIRRDIGREIFYFAVEFRGISSAVMLH